MFITIWEILLANSQSAPILLPFLPCNVAFPRGAGGAQVPTCQCRRRKRHRFDPWVRKIPWRRACHPTPVLLPRGSHGQRSLEGCSPQGHRVGHDWSNLACSTWHTRLREREEFSSVHFFVRIICACIMSIVSKLQCFFIFNFCSLRGLSSSVCVCLVAQSCPTLCDPMDCSLPDSSVHGDSPGKNTGVGCHALLQGIFPVQGWNPGLPHCRQIPSLTEPPGKPNQGFGSGRAETYPLDHLGIPSKLLDWNLFKLLFHFVRTSLGKSRWCNL